MRLKLANPPRPWMRRRWLSRSTYETSQPWVVYHYGLTHDGWWPFWTSTRFLGRCRIGMECAVCGAYEIANLRIPRFGPVHEPASGRHLRREQFLADHAHPDRGAPMSWARPLLNPVAHPGGLNLVTRARGGVVVTLSADDRAFHSLDLNEDGDGWWWATCACGWQRGPFPGPGEATDDYGDHREATAGKTET